MIGWIAGDDLGLRVEDRLAEVGLVGDRPSRRSSSCTGLPKSPSSAGPRAARVGAVAGDAAELLEQLLARAAASDAPVAAAPLEPGLVLGRLHDDDLPIMPECSVPQYSAQKRWYVARLGRLEPQRSCSGREHVLLDAEGRHVEAVDHVLGGHRQLDRPADRHVQLVDLALALEVLHLPHPLLADDVDLAARRRAGATWRSRRWRPRRTCTMVRPNGIDRPGELERQRAVDRRGRSLVRAAAVRTAKKTSSSGDEQREEER